MHYFQLFQRMNSQKAHIPLLRFVQCPTRLTNDNTATFSECPSVHKHISIEFVAQLFYAKSSELCCYLKDIDKS